jgi:hypothetical protein
MLGGWKRGKGLLMRLISGGGISVGRRRGELCLLIKGIRGILLLLRLVNKCMLV